MRYSFAELSFGNFEGTYLQTMSFGWYLTSTAYQKGMYSAPAYTGIFPLELTPGLQSSWINTESRALLRSDAWLIETVDIHGRYFSDN